MGLSLFWDTQPQLLAHSIVSLQLFWVFGGGMNLTWKVLLKENITMLLFLLNGKRIFFVGVCNAYKQLKGFLLYLSKNPCSRPWPNMEKWPKKKKIPKPWTFQKVTNSWIEACNRKGQWLCLAQFPSISWPPSYPYPLTRLLSLRSTQASLKRLSLLGIHEPRSQVHNWLLGKISALG